MCYINSGEYTQLICFGSWYEILSKDIIRRKVVTEGVKLIHIGYQEYTHGLISLSISCNIEFQGVGTSVIFIYQFQACTFGNMTLLTGLAKSQQSDDRKADTRSVVLCNILLY